jgi:hypothetical protein
VIFSYFIELESEDSLAVFYFLFVFILDLYVVDIQDDEIDSVREEFTKNRNNLAAIKESLRKTMENEFDDIIEEVCRN